MIIHHIIPIDASQVWFSARAHKIVVSRVLMYPKSALYINNKAKESNALSPY
jgi:hypothetical protein